MFQLLVVFQFELLFTVGEDSKIVWRFRLKKNAPKTSKATGERKQNSKKETKKYREVRQKE